MDDSTLNQNGRGINVLVIADGGKLIFHRYEDDNEEDLYSICGLIQAVR